MMSDQSPLYTRYNYIIPDKMISYNYLIEYDIKHANTSILFGAGKIDQTIYDLYNTIPKQQREIAIGLKIAEEKEDSFEETGKRYSETETIIKNTIIDFKKKFVETNHIHDEQIVRIANDALLIRPWERIDYTVFPFGSTIIEFKVDGIYTSMVKLADTIILFNSENCTVDVKGIDDNRLWLCEKFLTSICEIILYIEKGDTKIAKMKYIDFYDDYINLKLPIEYYREFNAGTGYRIKYNGILTVPRTARLLDLGDHFDKTKLDISYNLYVLRDLYDIIIRKIMA